MSQNILFEDIFNVTGLNLAGKKFERGKSVECCHCEKLTRLTRLQ